ncbi:MAG TPA: ATP cone domain-containing protein, partial [bacterium]|nr:ATP cone domain-containing protein [bacterium]
MKITSVKKRNGQIEKFAEEKITIAIYKALKARKKDDFLLAESLCKQVVKSLEKEKHTCVSVEHIQDVVE